MSDFQARIAELGPLQSLVGKGTKNSPQTRDPMGIIYHTPGRTFVQRQMDKLKKPTPAKLERACALAFDVMPFQPHILIGYSKVYQLEAFENRCFHAGSLKTSVYARDWRLWAKPLGGNGWMEHKRNGHVVYDWWDKVYGDRANPAKIFPWGYHPNFCIGVDLLPDLSGKYNDYQAHAANVITKALSLEFNFPIDKFHCTTHSYASPCERGAVMRGGRAIGIHWDPDIKVWAPDWDQMQNLQLNPNEEPPHA